MRHSIRACFRLLTGRAREISMQPDGNRDPRLSRTLADVEPMTNSGLNSIGEMSIRADNKATAIFVAFHFFPSREVGAKRMSALAQYLAAQGRSVAVVSAFAGLGSVAEEKSADAMLSNYDIARVPDGRSTIDTALINAKKSLRRCVSLVRGATQNSPVDSTSAAVYSGPNGSAFQRALFTVLRVIDDKK